MGIRERVQHAWNAFMNKDPTGISSNNYYSYGGNISSVRPDRPQFTRSNRKSIVTAVYNRIAMDAAQIEIKHVRLDSNERYIETIDSTLNNCLSIEANTDQTGRAFIQDVVMSMLDEGCVAIVPVDTSSNPMNSMSYDILTLRTGRIMEWYPKGVKVKLYNERTGNKEDIIIPKHMVAIVENPLYAIINEQNSTMQRLIRKMNLLDVIDEKKGADKLDLIIQLPYVIKTEARRQQAETRRKDIEMQLSSSQYGIAYTDGTEKITQLNRSVDNQLQSQVEYLTSMLYSQLGLTVEIMNGTADEKVMLNYYNRTIEPILAAITDEMKRKFLTKTARSQKQSIEFFRDPFRLVPVADLAELADKFTRNEIMTSNEIRSIVGMKPSSDPSADELRNKNLSQSNVDIQAWQEGYLQGEQEGEEESGDPITKEEFDQRMAELDDLDAQLDETEAELEKDDEKKKVLKHYASPYYDPVKAHEYYEAHKKLKGRHLTKGLNETGKSAAEYVKNKLNEERRSKVEAHGEQTNRSIETNNAQKKIYIGAAKETKRCSNGTA